MLTVVANERQVTASVKGVFAVTKEPQANDSDRRASAEAGRSLAGPDSLQTEFALVRIARAIRELRRVRRDEFGLNLAEPAWDMLVELYFRDSTGASTTATQLKEAAYAPSSAADRWLQHLENEGLVRSKAHPTEVQTEFVELTDEAREALERYLAAVRAVAAQQTAGEEAG